MTKPGRAVFARVSRALLFAAFVPACAHDSSPPVQRPPAPKPEARPAPSQTEPELSQATAAPAAQDVETRELGYAAGGTQMQGFMAYPAGATGKRPGVLVVHEFWGLNQHARTRAKKLAEMGYVALAVDMYGGGKLATHPDDARKFSREVMENLDEGVKRFEAARDALAADPRVDADKIAAIGYCFGGAVVLHMARTGMDLDAVASFHGGLGTRTPMQPGAFDGLIFVAHGGADSFIPQEEVDAFHEEMQAAGADYELVVYPDATHSFTNPGATEAGKKHGMPVEYNPRADAASWQKLAEVLERAFAEDPEALP